MQAAVGPLGHGKTLGACLRASVNSWAKMKAFCWGNKRRKPQVGEDEAVTGTTSRWVAGEGCALCLGPGYWWEMRGNRDGFGESAPGGPRDSTVQSGESRMNI